MNSRFFVAVIVSASVSQGRMSPVSGYQYAFVRCVPAASVPKVRRVSKYER